MAAFIAKHQKNVVTSGAQANVHAFAFGAFSSASNPTCLRKRFWNIDTIVHVNSRQIFASGIFRFGEWTISDE
jgi:hypothetical protein